MGAAVAARLREHGTRVLTSLAGRSDASAARARAAGMTPVDGAALADADLFLAIVPPRDAVATAERFAPLLVASSRPPTYVDCNAVAPATTVRIAAIVAAHGVRFVDAGIIGARRAPARRDRPSTAFADLADDGLAIRVLAAPIGAASSLKMSYAGITKGLTALGTAMILAASRAGVAAELRAELGASQPALLARLTTSVPDMVPKAYRWDGEMDEIAAFSSDDATAAIYHGFAAFYRRIADDAATTGSERETLAAFFGSPGNASS